MKRWWWRCTVGFLFAALSVLAVGQAPHPQDPTAGLGQKGDDKLPNGKSQRDEILKAEHEQNVKDAAQLTEMAQQLQQDIEKEDRFVLSISTLKKTEEIEKLARKIRSRLRHN